MKLWIVVLFQIFLFLYYGDHRDLHSFPTRRSSDLEVVNRARGALHAAALAEVAARLFQVAGLHCFAALVEQGLRRGDRKSTRLNSSHGYSSYAVFCL